jgi:signal transduction histidine kinase
MPNSELLNAIVKAAQSKRENILCSLLDAIGVVVKTSWCSLWRINPISRSLSLAALSKESKKQYGQDIETVHPIDGSLIGDIILPKFQDNNIVYSEIKDITADPYWNYHRSKDRATSLGLKRLVSIAIPNYESPTDKKEGILNIYLPEGEEFSEEMAQIIRDEFSLVISRNRLFRREALVSYLVEQYKIRGKKDLASVMHPIINKLSQHYIPCEGCSIFVWDPIFSRLTLEQTTGIKNRPRKKDVYYNLGEGLTGFVANNRKEMIIPELSNISDQLIKSEYLHRWQENTAHEPKSWMAVPIMNPAQPEELVGIIRFTNRLNSYDKISIDCFTQGDLVLIDHISNLLGLYIQADNLERLQTAFAKQMAHEMLTPSAAIRGTGKRLLTNWQMMSDNNINSYLQDIIDQTELQIALTRTVQSVWMSSTILSKRKIYRVRRVNLDEAVLRPAKKIVIPMAREKNVLFDNIEIRGFFPNLYIDKHAFQVVFFNLLTNAIKYREPNAPDEFKVIIEGGEKHIYGFSDDNNTKKEKVARRGYLIKIKDYGIGISSSETEKLFLLGYRGRGVERQEVVGLGLGLTAVKKILNAFYCHIWISKLKKPTQFNIFIDERLETNRYIKSDEWINL